MTGSRSSSLSGTLQVCVVWVCVRVCVVCVSLARCRLATLCWCQPLAFGEGGHPLQQWFDMCPALAELSALRLRTRAHHWRAQCVRTVHACTVKLWLGQLSWSSQWRTEPWISTPLPHMLSVVTFKCQPESDAGCFVGDNVASALFVVGWWCVVSVLCSLSDDTHTRLQHHTVSSRCVAAVRIGSPVLLCGMRATVWRLSPLSCAPLSADMKDDCEQNTTWRDAALLQHRWCCMCSIMRAVTDATRVALASAPPSATDCRSGGL